MTMRIVLFAVMALLFDMTAAHNWMNTPGRAIKVSFVRPCPARVKLEQTHVQVNPGGGFPIEWATGHGGSKGNWILVKAEDEMKLKGWARGVAGMPSAGAAYFAEAPDSAVEKYQTFHNGGRAGPGKTISTSCAPAKDTVLFTKQVSKDKVYQINGKWYNRPDHYHGPDGKNIWEINPALKDDCAKTKWVGYKNAKHPWIVAASSYTIPLGAAADGGLSHFKIPDDADAGKYVLQWNWRGVVNCLDVNVVPKSKPVTDMFGSPPKVGEVGDGKHAADGAAEIVVSKIDHCQVHRKGRYSSNPDAEWFGDSGDSDDRIKAAEKAIGRKLLGDGKQDILPLALRKNRLKLGYQRLDQNEKLQKNYIKDFEAKRIAYNAQKNEEGEKGNWAKKLQAKYGKDWKASQEFKAGMKDYGFCSQRKCRESLSFKMKEEMEKIEKAQRNTNADFFAPITMSFLGRINIQDWGTWYPRCRVVLNGEDPVQKCSKICQPQLCNRDKCSGYKCDSVNIVPWKHPATSAFAGQVNSMIPQWCLDAAIPAEVDASEQHPVLRAANIPDDARICYQLQEPDPTDAGPGRTVTDDPKDPVWYSTCLKITRNQQRIFSGNTCGEPCKLGDGNQDVQWRFGDQCVACDMYEKNKKEFIPEWALAPSGTCKKCGANVSSSTAPTPPTPTPPTPTPPTPTPPAPTPPTSGGGTGTKDPSCQHGIRSAGTSSLVYCCAKSCGTCSGKGGPAGCAGRPGGANACCPKNIRTAKRSCHSTTAPCTFKKAEEELINEDVWEEEPHGPRTNV